MPVQVRELFNRLNLHLLLEGHQSALQSREHWIERRGQHVTATRAADAAGCRQRWCLRVAHAIGALILVCVQYDGRPV